MRYVFERRCQSLSGEPAEAEKARRGDSGDKEEPPAFWDHSREMALGGRLMDEKTRGKFIQEARGLGDRFGSGKSGGFL